MSRRGLYSIAPHGRFLELLVDRILDGTLLKGWDVTGPFGLSDITIIVPTRRARLTLAQLFAERAGGAVLLPDIRTFGGEPGEEEPFLPPVDMPATPPTIGTLERRLILSRLVQAFAISNDGFATPPNAAEILRLAESLGEVIDDLIVEEVAFGRLVDLVPEQFAANWQDILTFLDIALSAWPKVLVAVGKVDAATARNARLKRQAATARTLYGERPVIAAGSTGSVPATAALLKAIAELPRGAIVLPGLDTTLTPEQHDALLDPARSAGHPQYQLAQLLRRLGAGIGEVAELAGQSPRTELVRRALAPPDETAQWAEVRPTLPVAEALAGVRVIAAPGVDLEARAIALAAREAVAATRSVGIVARDQTLARRIRAELDRFGISVDDPAGTPLYQSAAGRLARQILAVVDSDWGAVDTLALLRNGAVTLGRSRGEISHLADRLDHALRRGAPVAGLAGLLERHEPGEARDLLDDLGRAIDPVVRLCEAAEVTPARLAGALLAAVMALADDTPLPGLVELRRWAEEVASADGLTFAPRQLDGVLAALMAGITVETGYRRRDDVHVWGELEARLMSPDVMILAGLNEDIWPPAADPGPWLSRGMRLGLGLEPPERRQGQAAHDFEMAVGNAEVVLAYAERIGASPALPSRFLQRLDALIGEQAAKDLRAAGDRWLRQARAIDAAGPPRPAGRPLPRPPAHLRPRRLSVTEIETLIRSPYDLYARHVLRLKPLDPLGRQVEPRDRGTAVHRTLARFVADCDVMAGDAAARLMQIAAEEFAGLGTAAAQRDIWLRRFADTAEAFLAFERARQDRVLRRHAERDGRYRWETPEPFELVGRADRIDRMADGSYEILDFKTGTPPAPQQMRNFEAPQLLLEARLAELGAYGELPAGPVSALTYIKIGLGPDAFTDKRFVTAEGLTLEQMIERTWVRMQGHVEALLLRDTLAMAARIRPAINQRFAGPYDHLARTDEWTLAAEAAP